MLTNGSYCWKLYQQIEGAVEVLRWIPSANNFDFTTNHHLALVAHDEHGDIDDVATRKFSEAARQVYADLQVALARVEDLQRVIDRHPVDMDGCSWSVYDSTQQGAR